MDKPMLGRRHIRLTAKDEIEIEAYRALKIILESPEYRRSVTDQLVSLARRLDDDDPYYNVAEACE